MSEGSTGAVPGYAAYEFDLPAALLEGLLEKLAAMLPARLSWSAASAIPDEQGVYQLFLDETLVYIGKTDSEAGLRRRLARHAGKIEHRKGLDPTRVWFKAMRIFVFTAVDLESALIKRAGGVSKVAWSGSGFGSNDPGRERDTSTVKDDHFDALHPIDIDRPIDLPLTTSAPAASVLTSLKDALPYTFRFQTRSAKSKTAHADLLDTILPAPPPAATARTLITHVVGHLPPGWQATALPGYVILYKERRDDYPRADIIARS